MATESLRSGQRLGRYQLDARIALGGSAEVWSAKEWAAPSKRWALKVMRQSFVEDPDFADMFADEVSLSTRLRHENIVTVLGSETIDGRHLQVMELLEGDDLRRLMSAAEDKGWRIPVPIVVAVARSVSRALSYAHARRTEHGQPLLLVHRDISPHNIFLTVDGEVKLLDFGIAKATERLHKTRGAVVKGKSAYMAPEQVVARGQLDHRTDMFATGVVLWEMLTQRRLFAASTDVEAMEKVLTANVPPIEGFRSDVPSEVAELIHTMLARRPRDRLAHMSDVERRLQRIVIRGFEPEEVSTDAVGAWVQKVRAETRRKMTARLPRLPVDSDAANATLRDDAPIETE